MAHLYSCTANKSVLQILGCQQWNVVRTDRDKSHIAVCIPGMHAWMHFTTTMSLSKKETAFHIHSKFQQINILYNIVYTSAIKSFPLHNNNFNYTTCSQQCKVCTLQWVQWQKRVSSYKGWTITTYTEEETLRGHFQTIFLKISDTKGEGVRAMTLILAWT